MEGKSTIHSTVYLTLPQARVFYFYISVCLVNTHLKQIHTYTLVNQGDIITSHIIG